MNSGLFHATSARLVDEQVAEEVASSQKNGIMKNKQTSLFHQQNRANQRLMNTARKTRKETIMQDSLASIQSRVNNEKVTRQQSLLRQREYEESLKALTENGGANSRMNLALFEETSQLRKKIDNEKDCRRRSVISRNSLTNKLSEISASASGKPSVGVAKRLLKVIPEEIEASSSGRVSAAFVEVEFAQRRAQVSRTEEVKSYSDGMFRLILIHNPLTEALRRGKI